VQTCALPISQAFTKRMNRKLELLYREGEWLNVLGGILQGTHSNYPMDKITNGWQTILRNQFHDIIPGSSIKEVYDDAREEYDEAEVIVKEEWNYADRSFLIDR